MPLCDSWTVFYVDAEERNDTPTKFPVKGLGSLEIRYTDGQPLPIVVWERMLMLDAALEADCEGGKLSAYIPGYGASTLMSSGLRYAHQAYRLPREQMEKLTSK
jgi:hypothetical protein